MLPEDTISIPFKRYKRVLFPAPDGPMIDKKSPRSTLKEIFFKTSVEILPFLYTLLISLTLII